MPSATPKLAKAIGRDTVATWLAETIQEKAGKENAGLVEISLNPNDRTSKPPNIEIKTNSGARSFTIEIDNSRT